MICGSSQMSKSKKPEWLPKNIIIRRGWYKIRPYLGRENGKSIYGPEVAIVPVESTPQQFFKVYEKLTKVKSARTVQWLFDHFLSSEYIKQKTLKKQNDYIVMANNFCNTQIKSKSGVDFTLGQMPIEKLTKPKIQYLIDHDTYKIGINRKIQFFKSAWNWAETRFENMPPNPSVGVRLNKEKSRDRYIEDWEYWLVYMVANSMRSNYFAPAMELSYLCRARRNEVFSLTRNNLKEQGIFIERAKGSDNEITAYSTRLNAAIASCHNMNPRAPVLIAGSTLLHDKKGLRYTKNALDSQWQRIMKKAKTEGVEMPEDWANEAKKQGAKATGNRVYLSNHFTYHDIKAKGITDHAEENAGGHRTAKAAAIYQRKPKIVDATR